MDDAQTTPASPAMKTEKKDLPKSAKIALRELNKSYQAAIGELIESAADDLGLKPEEGWNVDQKTMTFHRQVEDK